MSGAILEYTAETGMTYVPQPAVTNEAIATYVPFRAEGKMVIKTPRAIVSNGTDTEPVPKAANNELPEVQFREEKGHTVAVMPLEIYDSLVNDIEALQDAVDALKVKARIASGETEVSDWAAFMAELDGLQD